MKLFAGFLAALCATGSAEQSLTFRDADSSKECVISYDGDTKLTTSCAFDTASGNALASRVGELESGLAGVQRGLAGVLNRLSTVDASISTLSDQNRNQDTAISAVTKMEGPKVKSLVFGQCAKV